MTQMTTLWTDPKNGLTSTQLKSVPVLRDLLRSCELSIAQALAEAQFEKLKGSQSEMKVLWRYIQANSPSNAAARSRLLILEKIVAYVNHEYPLSIPVLATPNVLTRPSNPHKDTLQGVIWAENCYDAHREVESRWLDNEKDAPGLELILYSGTLHGGLFHTSTFTCVATTLVSPAGKVGHIGDSVYLELNLPWRGKPNMERRLWFPDRQTASLIGRSADCGRLIRSDRNDEWRAIPPESIGEDVWRSMRRRMRQFGLPSEYVPDSLKHFVTTVSLAANACLPPILVSYATRRFISYSLKPESLDRLRGFELSQNSVSSSAEIVPLNDEKKLRALHLDAADNDLDEIGPRLFDQLRAAFSSKDERDVLRKLEEFIAGAGDSATAATRIAEFAVYLLTERHKRPSVLRRNKPKLVTVREYTNTLIRRFGCLLDGGTSDPVLDLSTDDLEAKCLEAIEGTYTSRNPGATNSLRRLLQEFFGFLEYKFGIEPMSPDVLGTEAGLVPVDATIIRVEDYYETRRYVREDLRGTYGGTVLRAVEAQIVLEYRCGLRRMEGIGLEELDIVDSGQGWVFVRPNAIRGIKTRRSLRQPPIYAECSAEEVEVISRWKRDLAAGIRYSQHVLMPIVLDAMRFATGMSKPRAHQWRHSCLSLNLMKMMVSELDEVPNFFPESPQTMNELRKGTVLRDALYGHPCVVSKQGEDAELRTTTRKHAYAITSLAGHALCETTAEHYWHVLCQLLRPFLEQSKRFSVTTRQFSIAAGCSERTAYSSNAASIPLHLWRKAFGPLIGDAPPEVAAGAISNAKGARRPFWRSAESFLMDCQEWPGAAIQELANKSGISIDLAERFAQNAFRIGAIREPRGCQTARHPLRVLADDDRVLPYLHLVPRPVRPTTAKDANVISTLQHRIEDAISADEVLGRGVLEYFAQNAWLTEEVLLFRDPAAPLAAKRHLQFLQMCDLTKEQIRLVSYDTSEDSRWARKWAKVLRLQECDLIPGGVAPFGASNASDKWLAIEPNLSGVRLPANRSVPGANGFRYMMTMAAIVFGLDDV